jgi:tyrosine-protein phosphatase YwqE
MKIDFHSHILPGLDDGATDLENAVELAAAMKEWGFERITCTPHITNKFRNTPETIRPAFEMLQNALHERGVNVELRMSAEYRLVPETWPEVLEQNWLMPIEDRFILMELPIFDPDDIKDIKPIEEFKKIKAMGLTPLLPHPERYFYLSHDELLRYVDAGVMIQSNYGSLAGVYGTDVKLRVQRLIDEGLVSFLATDMHNMHYINTIGAWLSAGNTLMDF